MRKGVMSTMAGLSSNPRDYRDLADALFRVIFGD